MPRSRAEIVSLKSFDELDGLESMRAIYKDQHFKPHSHDEYLVGVIERGAHEVSCRNESIIADAGTVVVMNPGDVHFGKSGCEDGWTQRFVYVREDVMIDAMNDVLDIESDIPPSFDRVFESSPEVARSFAHFHEVLHSSTFSLTRDVAMEAIMKLLFQTRYRNPKGDGKPVSIPTKRMRMILDYMHANIVEDIRMEELCRIAGVRKRQLIDNFKEATGLPPHAYHVLLKTNEVKRLLRNGLSATEASAAVGFADQSHMSRHFVAIVGMTPAKYAESVS